MSNNKFELATPVSAPVFPVVITENPAEKTKEHIQPSIKAYNDKLPNRLYWRPAMDVYNSDGVVIGRDT